MFWFFWFLLAVAVGVLANNRGRSGFGWFLLAACLSPLIGFIFVLIAKDLSATGSAAATAAPSGATHVRCPACAEWVLPEASVCKHCGGALTPDEDFHIVRARLKDAEKKDDSHNLAVGVSAIAGLFLIAIFINKCSG